MLGEYYVYTDDGSADLRFMGAATTGEELRTIISSITDGWVQLEIHARMSAMIVGNLVGRGSLHDRFYFQEHGACRGIMIELRELFSEVEDSLDVKINEKYLLSPQE